MTIRVTGCCCKILERFLSEKRVARDQVALGILAKLFGPFAVKPDLPFATIDFTPEEAKEIALVYKKAIYANKGHRDEEVRSVCDDLSRKSCEIYAALERRQFTTSEAQCLVIKSHGPLIKQIRDFICKLFMSGPKTTSKVALQNEGTGTSGRESES